MHGSLPRRTFAPTALALALLLRPAAAAASLPPAGVVMEEVEPDGAGQAAGLRPGDVLLSWERVQPAPAGGKIDWLNWPELEREQAPRGALRLLGRRDGKELSVTLTREDWHLKVRPELPGPELERYTQGRKRIEAGALAEGLEIWSALADEAGKGQQPEIALWLRLRASLAAGEERDFERAHKLLDAALDVAQHLGEPLAVLCVRNARVSLLQRQNQLEQACEAARNALEIRQQLAPDGLSVATSLIELGNLMASRSNLDEAERSHRKSLELVEAHAPGSLLLGRVLNDLGADLFDRNDFAAAEQYYRRALELRMRLAPDSLATAGSLNNLGTVLRRRGDLTAAEDHFRRALALKEKLAPESLTLARSLDNLALTVLDRGHLATAEQLLQRSHVLVQRLAPGSGQEAGTLQNLALVALRRKERARSEEIFRKSLEIQRRLAPDSLAVAQTLSNLGNVALLREDWAEAERLYHAALEIQRARAPGTLTAASTLNGLGVAAREKGDLEAAERAFAEALAIRQKEAPGSLRCASTLADLGRLAHLGGDLERAEQLYRKALEIQQRLAPDNVDRAETLHRFGLLEQDRGRKELALDRYTEAVAVLEQQTLRLGGTQESQAEFAAGQIDSYRRAIGLLVELGRPAEALHLLERSRSRVLLQLVAERDLILTDGISPELERERKLCDAGYDRLQDRLQELRPQEDAEAIGALHARLRELRVQRERIRQQLRKLSPRLAGLRDPEPLDFAGIRRQLDPGTLLLAYAAGEARSHLFVVRAEADAGDHEPRVFELPVGEAELRQKVEAFRKWIEIRPAGPTARERLRELGQSLYERLVRPAEELIGPARRVLICPDGPLHVLPFGALIVTGAPGLDRPEGPRYLIEWKPLHTAVSATLYAELRRPRAPAAGAAVGLAAFGDPRYPGQAAQQAAGPGQQVLRAAFSRLDVLEPLEGSREEVDSIVELYGNQARAYLGVEATEETARAASGTARTLHFACHAVLDERSPLDSALVLSLPDPPEPGRENGLLQAWEIFEDVRMDADLVVLSACRTALGRELGGEGLLGLTRAFQYAGARSVLATLWSVSDRSTARLMRSFHASLRSGLPKDQALREAQVQLIRESRRSGQDDVDTAHPFHWAGFVLIGDWRGSDGAAGGAGREGLLWLAAGLGVLCLFGCVSAYRAFRSRRA
jgi:CHAT domain-containing protein/Tfp pilus assembly protein PilF